MFTLIHLLIFWGFLFAHFYWYMHEQPHLCFSQFYFTIFCFIEKGLCCTNISNNSRPIFWRYFTVCRNFPIESFHQTNHFYCYPHWNCYLSPYTKKTKNCFSWKLFFRISTIYYLLQLSFSIFIPFLIVFSISFVFRITFKNRNFIISWLKLLL